MEALVLDIIDYIHCQIRPLQESYSEAVETLEKIDRRHIVRRSARAPRDSVRREEKREAIFPDFILLVDQSTLVVRLDERKYLRVLVWIPADSRRLSYDRGPPLM